MQRLLRHLFFEFWLLAVSVYVPPGEKEMNWQCPFPPDKHREKWCILYYSLAIPSLTSLAPYAVFSTTGTET